MAEKKVKRTTTKHKNIYYNESTRMYDVKYNYTEYDVATQKNRYKSKKTLGRGADDNFLLSEQVVLEI